MSFIQPAVIVNLLISRSFSIPSWGMNDSRCSHSHGTVTTNPKNLNPCGWRKLWGEGDLNRRVLLVFAVSSLVEDACGRVIEGVNCDSLGRKAPLVVVLSVLLLMVCSCYWR